MAKRTHEDKAHNASCEPYVIDQHYGIDYKHSYGLDSPFFYGLAEKKIKGTHCAACARTFATPRAVCAHCNARTSWVELPKRGVVHTYTTCYYGSEEFLKETPYTLILVELPGCETFLMSRLKDCDIKDVHIGMEVEAHFAKKPRGLATDLYFVPVKTKMTATQKRRRSA